MVTLFFDTEFTDLKQDCDLISIGVVAAENGSIVSGFYAESMDFSEDKCSEFVKDEVIPRLAFNGNPENQKIDIDEKVDPYSQAMCGTEEDIKSNLDTWIKQFDVESTQGVIQVWSDCLAYDWVLFCHLFDDVLPDYIYYIPFDVSTLMYIKGVDPDIKREEFVKQHADNLHSEAAEIILNDEDHKHNSLYDATNIYYCYKILMDM